MDPTTPGPDASPAASAGRRGAAWQVLGAFLRLGLTSFGGPVAHLGYFRDEFVLRRRWLDEGRFADIVALCQFLPGPASSQVGLCIGILRAGLPGALAAWIGFTMPSALAMILFAYGIGRFGDLTRAPWLHGLKIVAVAVVAQAVWGMARSLTPDRARLTLAIGAALLVLAVPSAVGQIAAIALGGLIGWRALPSPSPAAPAVAEGGSGPGPGHASHLRLPLGHGLSVAALAGFFLLLGGLPLLAAASADPAVKLLDSFYRSGALVFGGGHVVLPLLQAEVVPRGWVGADAFLAGYGAAQAVPGPLFTFAAYLGAAMRQAPQGWAGGLLCLAAIFLPSFLLVIGTLPYWDRLRRFGAVRAALRGVNAAVVGLLLAALYKPVWSSAIFAPADFGLGLVAFLLLAVWKLPPWLVVLLGALGAQALSLG